ncbi:MAG: hypothetical protein J1F35_08565 [Erysipelotrichales bacterium]|nr:hypothetical protein [Erysipelotrichales bacterium]
MSRSYQHHALRNKFKEAYWACVCYFSNKKDKRIANQRFRTKNKQLLKKILSEDPDEVDFHNKVREVSDTYDFSSDGLAVHHYLEDETEEDKNWNKKKSSK